MTSIEGPDPSEVVLPEFARPTPRAIAEMILEMAYAAESATHFAWFVAAAAVVDPDVSLPPED